MVIYVSSRMAFSTVSVSCCSVYPDLKSWNKAIKKNVQEGNVSQAFSSFLSMQERGLYPDNFTLPILIEVASRRFQSCLGHALHGQAVKSGYCDDLFVQTSLLNMYSSFDDLEQAYKVFENMPVKDIIAWNSMLDASASKGQMERATQIFESAPVKDTTSYNIMISGYAKAGKLRLALSLFDAAPARDLASWNSLILGYTLAGEMEEARRLFDEVSEKNIVTWNTMVSGYLQNELYVEAIDLFDQMRAQNLYPDHITISGVLAACAHLGSFESGRKIHIYAFEKNLMCPEVTSSLIDMYAKCGSIHHSLEVFYKSQAKDIFSWNAIISGLALNGQGDAALKLFESIKCHENLRPDDITFIALLTACSHSGLVQEGCFFFSYMKEYGISPKLEHYGCIVDLLGRANLLSQAFQLVKSMPFKPGQKILGALLNACIIHQDILVGKDVVRLLIGRREGMSDGDFMMVSSLYAICGEWEEAARWREEMNDGGIVKSAGCSVIELNGVSHRFLAGDLA